MVSHESTLNDEAGRRRRLPREVRERQMLDAARRAFGTHGFHGVSMDEIALAAGISKPMLYAYFESKDGLYHACLRRAGAVMIEAVAGATQSGPAEQRLWNGMVSFFRFINEHADDWHLIRRETLSGGGVFADEIADVRDALGNLVASVIDETIANDQLDFAVPGGTRPLAFTLIGAAESVANWWMHVEDSSPEDAASYIMNFVWAGLSKVLFGEAWQPFPAETAVSIT